MIAVTLFLVVMVISVADEHFPSIGDEIAAEHFHSLTVISTPATLILNLSLTHSSIREMSEPLFVSEVPSSLVQYVTSRQLRTHNNTFVLSPLSWDL